MANYQTIINKINEEITTNSQMRITGKVLNGVLTAMVASLGTGCRFGGIVTPGGTVTEPDGNVFYFATQGGTYTACGGVVIQDGVSVIKYDGGTWGAMQLLWYDTEPRQGSTRLVLSGSIYDALQAQEERFRGVEQDMADLIAKVFDDEEVYQVTKVYSASVTDTNSRQTARKNRTYLNGISAKDGAVITSLKVEMGGADITKDVYTGPHSAEIIGRASGNEASDLQNGDSWASGEITPDAGWGIKSVRVEMGDDDITSESLSGHEVSVADVRGDIAVEVETACEVVSTPFLSRITAGGLTLANTRALLKGIHGNTLVWNQMINNPSVEFVVDGSGSNYKYITLHSPIPNGHKVYVTMNVKKSTDFASGEMRVNLTENVTRSSEIINFNDITTNNVYQKKSQIVTATAESNRLLEIVTNRTGGSASWKDVLVIDLTQMFGAGNEPTLAEFEALYPLGNYATDAGRLIDFNGETLRSTKTAARSWNQLITNGDFSNGTTGWSAYSVARMTLSVSNGVATMNNIYAGSITGDNSALVQRISYIKGHAYYIAFDIKPSYNNGSILIEWVNTQTTLKTGLSNTSWNRYSAKFSSTKESSSSVGLLIKVGVGTNAQTVPVPEGGSYQIKDVILIDLTAMFGEGNEPSTAAEFEAIMEKLGNPATEEEFNSANLLQDITINPTAMQGYLNGEGEAAQIFPSGMRSAGSVFDTVEKVDGKWFAKVNVGSVEINPANVTWSQWGTNRVYLHAFTAINSADYCKAVSSAANRVSDRMTILANGSMAALAEGAKGYVAINGNLIYITTADYNDRANLATFSINYELATPRTYLFTDEWQQILNSTYKVETGGMEIILPENGSEPTTSPAKMEIQYGTDGTENN